MNFRRGVSSYGQARIFHGDDRVELIAGDILEMTTIVHVQNPARISDRSDTEPDVELLRPREDFYAGKRPTPEDVLLLIGVSDTALEFDRDVKVPFTPGQAFRRSGS